MLKWKAIRRRRRRRRREVFVPSDAHWLSPHHDVRKVFF
jgi:hypothetical protein